VQNSEELANRVNSILANSSKEEKARWKQHELTKATALMARACIASLHESWESGGLTVDSIEGSTMKNAEAIGTISAMRDVLEFIDDITLDEETNDD